MNSTLILASASPRRSELLEQIGLHFLVHPSTIEEQITKTVPSEVVMELSEQKCLDVANQFLTDSHNSSQSFIVIGADTIVADGERILGKPKDEADACSILTSLRGHSHSVYTGVTLCQVSEGKLLTTKTFFMETKVYMKNYSDTLIDHYIKTKEPMDKAGAYGIQGKGAVLVDYIEGDYNNVVGLPISRLYDELQQFSLF